MNEPMKAIRYRGGIVTFRVPAHWRAELAADGGGTFYDEAPDAGTLRLDVITAKAPFPVSAENAPEILAGLNRASADIERLPNGCALVRYTESTVERGHELLITYWVVANPIPPSHCRLATFSYTMLERQRTDARSRRELELVDREVRQARFAANLGS